MNQIFKSSYNRSYNYIKATFSLIIGLLLIIWPGTIAKVIVIALGALLTIIGILSFVFSRKRAKENSKGSSILSINGIVDIALGIIIMVFNQFFAGIVMFLFGAILLIFGISGIVRLVTVSKIERLSLTLFFGPIITTLCGLIIFFNPFKATEWTFIFFGIALIVYAISEFISTTKMNKIITASSQFSNKGEIEDAVIVEDE